MKNKNAFTLVELLAVISIIGVLALIILPNVVGSFNQSKTKNFLSEAQGVYKTSKNHYIMDSSKGYLNIAYINGYEPISDIYTKQLDVNLRQGYKYMIVFNENGDIYYFLVSDENYKIELGNLNNSSGVVNFKDVDASSIVDSSV